MPERSDVPTYAGLVPEQRPRYDRFLGISAFVEEEAYEANQSKNEGNEHSCGSPRVANAAPGEANDGGSSGGNNEGISASELHVRFVM